MPEQNTFDDVPRSALAHMGVKIYLVGALAWDYADTVLSLAAQMRLGGEYKKLARAVRELRRDYDSIRSFDLDADHIENERRLAELFESINKAHFSRLCNGLLTEIRHNSGIDGDMAYFIEAVQMAMTILDTMRLYADQCDVFIRRHYPSAPHSILPEQFRRLAALTALWLMCFITSFIKCLLQSHWRLHQGNIRYSTIYERLHPFGAFSAD